MRARKGSRKRLCRWIDGLLTREFKQAIIVLLLLAVALNLLCWNCSVAWAEVAVSPKIEAADTAVGLAFEAILDAEKFGANVSDLLGSLESAGALLSEARMAYAAGELEEANVKADSVISLAGAVQVSAMDVKYVALQDQMSSLNFTFVISVVGAAVFVVVLALVWLLFKRVYGRRVLGMKPEVVGHA